MAKTVFSFFNDIKENHATKKANEAKHNAESVANDLFQIKENNQELWLTYDGELVCPCSMLQDDAVMAVTKMREMYIERQTR